MTLADFSATLGAETLALDASGHATFQFVAPGTYPLSFTGPTGVTFVTDPVATTATPIQVTVPSGQAVSVSATITSATSP